MPMHPVDHPSGRHAAAVQIYDRYLQVFLEAARRDTIGDAPARCSAIEGAQVIDMHQACSRRRRAPLTLHHEIVLL